jgi:hypothetical protein
MPSIGFDEAPSTILSAVRPMHSETAALAQALGRVEAGVLPHFILSFILGHRPIFGASDFPMLLGFRFSTDRTLDSIRVSFYHYLWDF